MNEAEIAERKRALAAGGAGHPGNAARYDARATESRPNSILQGKRVIFLGSSIVAGSFALGQSFADCLEARDGVIALKEAVAGTLLVDDAHDGSSYGERLRTLDPTVAVDAVVCQLSTNDAYVHREDGVNGQGGLPSAAVEGALADIVDYARATWGCPTFFFTAAPFENEAYAEMVGMLKRLAERKGALVIDFFSDASKLPMDEGKRALYWYDAIHPTRAGYLMWWTPVFEEVLGQWFSQSNS